MPFEIISCRQGFNLILYSGTVDFELRLEALQTVEAASKGTPIKGNLIDFRNAKLACSFNEQFQFATKATTLSGHRGKRAAYLVKDTRKAPIEILELAMSNRGIETRLFMDESEAFEWLTGGCFQSCEDFNMDCCPLRKIKRPQSGEEESA